MSEPLTPSEAPAYPAKDAPDLEEVGCACADGHPDLQDLIDCSRRNLSEEKEAAVLAHCETCPDCFSTVKICVVLRMGFLSDQRKKRRRRQWCSGALAGALLAIAIAGFWHAGYFTSTSSKLAALAAGEPIRADRLLDELASDLFFSSDPRDGRVALAVEALMNGDHATAVEELETIIKDEPSDDAIAAWLGIALYSSGDDSARTRALLGLGASRRSDALGRAAMWYLANSNLRDGNMLLAVIQLGDLCADRSRDRRSRSACELLEEIRYIKGTDGCSAESVAASERCPQRALPPASVAASEGTSSPS
jgi:hypothetical protein